jgi:UDP-N-acetylmuramate--alanine ligase
MSALAKFISVQGYHVAGSDGVRSNITEQLAFYGIKVYIGEAEEREEISLADVIVYTDAIPPHHVELSTAKRLQKRLISRGEFLAIISKQFTHILTVAGSHGKTTCTSMCAHILKEACVPFTAHIGGEDSILGNYASSGMEYFVTEACEYKKNLLKLSPETAILLNIDNDHMECYRDSQELTACFRQYCENAKSAFVCADDENSRSLSNFTTFGMESPLADYRAVELRIADEKYSFTVEEYGKPLCRVRLNALGRYNVYNALAAFAAMRSFGFSEKEIAKGLENFKAVKRRFEKIGEYKGATFICDYAHHPKETAATVKTASAICRGEVYVIFQPHTYSRTKALMEDFRQVLQPLKNLLIYKTYPARETYDALGSAETLAQVVGGCLYAENIYALKLWLKKTLREKDMVLFLGAGDIYYAAQYLLKELK